MTEAEINYFEREFGKYWKHILKKNKRRLVDVSKTHGLKEYKKYLNDDFSSVIRELCLIFETELKYHVFYRMMKMKVHENLKKQIVEEELDRKKYGTNTELVMYLFHTLSVKQFDPHLF